MLDNVLAYQCASNNVFEDVNYIVYFTSEEWLEVKKCVIFYIYFLIIKFMSGSSYVISNLYFIEVWQIEC